MFFPFGRVRILVDPVFRVKIFITETFWTKAEPNEVVTKLGDVALQRQRAQHPLRSQVFSGVTFPGLLTVKPLKTQETEFLKTAISFRGCLSTAVHVCPPRGWVVPVLHVSNVGEMS